MVFSVWRYMMPDSEAIPVAPDSARPVETSIASSIIPYDRDDEAAMYFGYRVCGLSVREALQLIDRSKAWLSGCRHDPKFVELESRIPELRQELSRDYNEIEWFRNFRLVLEKDYRVLKRSLEMEKDSDGKPVKMSDADTAYLLKLRSQYTPQQLGMLETILKASGSDNFNFAKWVSEHQEIVQMSRTDTITLKRQKSNEEEH
jgi:hypothetical protein